METPVAQSILIHQFENGLTLLAEPMNHLESVAFGLHPPAGYIYENAETAGLANFTCEMALRGCGGRTGRQFIEALDNLGVSHSSNVSSEFVNFRGAMPAEKLRHALPIFADLVRKPLLPEEQIEEARLVCLQELRAIEDDLPQQTFAELRQRTFPAPYGNSHYGTRETLEKTTAGHVRTFIERNYRPAGAVLSIAGKFEWSELKDLVALQFGDWNGPEAYDVELTPPPEGNHHIEFASNQTQIGISYEWPAYRDPDYFLARAGVGVLSDGMSSRLFTEVREERGLAYSVGASYESLRDQGAVIGYASSTPERAQETLDVMIGEFKKLEQGITEEELARLKVQLKTGLVMEQESSRARCGSIAGDWRLLGRIRTRAEVLDTINELTREKINAYLADNPPRNFRIVTLGEKELEPPSAVS